MGVGVINALEWISFIYTICVTCWNILFKVEWGRVFSESLCCSESEYAKQEIEREKLIPVFMLLTYILVTWQNMGSTNPYAIHIFKFH